MEPRRLEIRRVPCAPQGRAWAARVEDWIEDGRRIVRLSEEHRRRYRATVCARCSPERQARRRCAALTEGCSVRSCDHMDRAFYSRYRRIVAAHHASHPMLERIRLNAALGGRGSSGGAPPERRARELRWEAGGK